MRNRYEYQRNSYPYNTYSYPWLSSAEQGVWMPGMGSDDREERKDLEYWKQLYPAQTRRIQREVERQCDMLDYDGSIIYDEYPDRIALAQICEAIYQALMQEDAQNAMREYPAGMPGQDLNRLGDGIWRRGRNGGKDIPERITVPENMAGDMDTDMTEDMAEDLSGDPDTGAEMEEDGMMSDDGSYSSDYIAPEEETDEAYDFRSDSGVEMMQVCGGGRCMQDLIEVLLYNEIHRRRCRRRRGRSWYFGG